MVRTPRGKRIPASAGGVAAVLVLMLLPASSRGADDFTTFETGQVRPLALSPDGNRLFVANTPDAQLDVFAIGADGRLTYSSSVPVGLEPLAVAARSNSEVWVVNHLSDSISIVDVASTPPQVTRTLLVGDEPRDIVFAGPGGNRAFITTAHRGQNHPLDPQLTSPGVGRADVWVFDATDLGTSLAGTPETIVTLFGDTPRALAASPDGTTVYAAVFHSGNQTTTISEPAVCNGGAGAGPCLFGGLPMPGGLPGPNVNVEGEPQPETGLIVRLDAVSGEWRDPLARSWNNAVPFDLPDLDVFAIDATANPPVQAAAFGGVGTILFNLVVNPVSNKVYVSNTEARNEVRFEGPGIFGGSTVRGHLHEARITVLDGGNVLPRHLNKHINYDVVASSRTVRRRSLATPLGMVVSGDGTTLYVAAFGSSRIGVFDTSELESDAFVPNRGTQIEVNGGGPTGLALHEQRGKLYVLTRFDNAVSVVDLVEGKEEQHVRLNSPEPFDVIRGRPFLYDADFTSSNGEASCSTCHVFGDFDSLAWDLGNPDDFLASNPGPFIPPFALPQFNTPPDTYRDFHPMKGPMTTQTLRGMAGHGPMHWRGDRTGGNDSLSVPPNGGSFSEVAAFKKFNPAFEGLLGRRKELKEEEMQAFTDFILQVTLPPNPIRALDNTLTTEQQAGRDFYFGPISDTLFNCNGCHVLDPQAGFFGGDGRSTFEGESQFFKVPHLRNAYQKVGMFAVPGDQVRGSGFLHDGAVDTVFTFLHAGVFQFDDDDTRREVEAFILAYDSNLAPIVGQQVTLTDTNAATVNPRIDLLIARAQAGECDLIVKGKVNGEPRGAYLTAGGVFQTDRAADAPLTDAQVRALATTPGQEQTYTCVPPGTGMRAAVDRDQDTAFDGDELDAGTDPGSRLTVPPSYITCSGARLVESPRLVISRNDLPAGNESLSLKGEIVFSPSDPKIDLLADGFQLKVNDKDGNNVFYRVVPRGDGVRQIPGWKVSRNGKRWTYRDRGDEVGGGIRKIAVRDTFGRYSLRVVGRSGLFHVEESQLPLEVVIILGGPEQGANEECAVRAFNPDGGPSPSCRISTSGRSVRCG